MNAQRLPDPAGLGMEYPRPDARSRRDHGIQPARPLGPKAKALQAQRRQRSAARQQADVPPHAGLRLCTADGSLSYLLRGAGRSLFIERTQRRPLGTHMVHAAVFCSREDFRRWCDAEPLRFEEPHLHQRLLRQGEEFFDAAT